jgi:hypothetical protein
MNREDVCSFRLLLRKGIFLICPKFLPSVSMDDIPFSVSPLRCLQWALDSTRVWGGDDSPDAYQQREVLVKTGNNQ